MLSLLTALSGCALGGLAPIAAEAYGPVGHRIAGLAAEPLLCERAASAIGELTDGEPLSDLGLWADRIRDTDRWRHTAPWHYMNIDDGVALADFVPPEEGDVISAIEDALRNLEAPQADGRGRAESLKFLIHFVVDVHQPLHVGRADDRGGNSVDVSYGRFDGNLHRFWDTEAILLSGLSDSEYAASIGRAVRRFARVDAGSTTQMWAQESLELRSAVYGFDRASGELDDHYLDAARQISRERLTFAAARLANTLNGIFCD